uniref:Cathepsin B-like cysteine proteinase n=1 Tax=Bursaphelenchus xylophilus TaxID=6326 RepID=D1MBS2_BURXY|nr:cathepsin B-like cysteine proteinase [Bursaphelenchus xylophilus]
MLKFATLVLFLIPVAASLSGQELVDYINKNGLFKAVYNPSAGAYHFGRINDPLRKSTLKKRTEADYDLSEEIPESFDAAEKWPECAEVFNNIRDQSNCGSCWAVSSAGVMSDRICVATNGKVKVSISGIATASCVGGDGCNGGLEEVAFEKFIENGFPTGSEVDKHQGCQPYPFKHCAHHVNSTEYPPCDSVPEYKADTCSHECQKDYDRKYEEDLYYGKEQYGFSDEAPIQREIMTNGPVAVSFTVYESFLYYSGGIYRSTPGERIKGYHAVRVVGWGVENGTKYWKIANSWNEQWGRERLLPHTPAGVDESDIEDGGVAVTIDTSRLPGHGFSAEADFCITVQRKKLETSSSPRAIDELTRASSIDSRRLTCERLKTTCVSSSSKPGTLGIMKYPVSIRGVSF